MPTQSDHPLDELLRAYAAKRREDAGEPLELHPATRRLLQGEVARRTPKVSRSQWLGVFSGPWLWPRVSLVGSCLVLAGVLAWIWVQSLPPHDETRIAQHKPTPPPAAPAPKPAVPEPEPLRALGADSVFRELTPKDKQRAAAPAPAPSIAGKLQSKSNAPEGTASRTQPQDATLELAESAGRRDFPPKEEERALPAARLDSESAPRFKAKEGAGRTAPPLAATPRFRYERIDRAAPARNDDAASVGGVGGIQPGLLASFELEQWEQRVRILDADGSVYEGFLVDGELPGGKAAERPLPDQPGRAGAKPEAPGAPALAPSEANRSAVTFRVSGTNRSMDQLVVINGTLSSPAAELGSGLSFGADSFGADSAASRAADPTPPSSPAPVVTAAPLLLKSTGRSPAPIALSSAASESKKASVETPSSFPLLFRGTAIIGGTNKLRIEALRVTQ